MARDCLSERGYTSTMCIIFIFLKLKLSNYRGCTNKKNVYKIFVLSKKHILYKFYAPVYMQSRAVPQVNSLCYFYRCNIQF